MSAAMQIEQEPIEFTLSVGELRAALAAVIPHVGERYPVVELTTHETGFRVVATDGCTMAIYGVVPRGEGETFLISVKDAKDLAKTLRGAKSAPHVIVRHMRDGTLSLSLVAIGVRVTIFPSHQTMPEWANIIPRAFAETKTAPGLVEVDPTYYAKACDSFIEAAKCLPKVSFGVNVLHSGGEMDPLFFVARHVPKLTVMVMPRRAPKGAGPVAQPNHVPSRA